jgi:hypothetical protein
VPGKVVKRDIVIESGSIVLHLMRGQKSFDARLADHFDDDAAGSRDQFSINVQDSDTVSVAGGR